MSEASLQRLVICPDVYLYICMDVGTRAHVEFFNESRRNLVYYLIVLFHLFHWRFFIAEYFLQQDGKFAAVPFTGQF